VTLDDGTQITGNATLEAIFDVGGGNEYHLLDVIAPDVVGVRTLLDARERSPRVIGAGGGLTVNVGSIQEDAAQRVTGQFSNEILGIGGSRFLDQHIGVFSLPAGTATKNYVASAGSAANTYLTDFDNADSTSPNASKTDDVETRMKNYSVGIPSILVINEI